MGLLLRATARQLFTVIAILFLITGAIITTPTEYFKLADALFYDRIYFFLIIPLTALIYFVFMACWQYQLGTTFAQKLLGYSNRSLLMFRGAVLIPPIIILLAILHTLFRPSSVVVSGPFAGFPDGSISLHLITICAICWAVGLCLKYYHLVSVLNQIRHPRIPYGFRSEINLALLFLWPIGIWVLQPRIKAFHEDTITNQTIDHMVD